MERILAFSFHLARREPKILLPNVLQLIASIPLVVFLFQFYETVGTWALIGQSSTGSVAAAELANFFIALGAVLVPSVLALVLLTVFLSCVYVDIVRQAYTKKQILLNNAFSVGRKRFLPLLWTSFLEVLIVIGVSFGLMFGSVFLAVLAASAGVFIIPIGFLLFFISFLLFIVFFYETSAVVVLENLSGLKAIKRSYRIARRHFWPMAAAMMIVWLVYTIVGGSLSSIPYFGFVLSLVAGLFFAAWSLMTPAAFYYEYEKKNFKR